MKTDKNIILVSASPRRRQILHDAGFRFEVIPSLADESYDPELPVERVPELLARRKVETFANKDPEKIIIGADTVVIIEGRILNKPENRLEAIEMLSQLSNKTHRVVTGVCIDAGQAMTTFSDTAFVHFGSLSEKEIEYYVDQYAPFDKAGAYGVQDFIGMIGIHRLEGSFYTVMGLPVHLVYACLKPYIHLKES